MDGSYGRLYLKSIFLQILRNGFQINHSIRSFGEETFLKEKSANETLLSPKQSHISQDIIEHFCSII